MNRSAPLAAVAAYASITDVDELPALLCTVQPQGRGRDGRRRSQVVEVRKTTALRATATRDPPLPPL